MLEQMNTVKRVAGSERRFGRAACTRPSDRLFFSALLAVLLVMVSSSILVDAGRPFPPISEDDSFIKAPPRPDEWEIVSSRSDLSKMSCLEANEYMAHFEAQLKTPPRMLLDLERVCVSLRSAMIGMPRCQGFKPTGSFAKLFRVCKIATNNGMLTCSAASETACGSFS